MRHPRLHGWQPGVSVAAEATKGPAAALGPSGAEEGGGPGSAGAAWWGHPRPRQGDGNATWPRSLGTKKRTSDGLKGSGGRQLEVARLRGRQPDLG